MTALEAFHFLRPLWLIALPLIAALWWSVRRAHRPRAPKGEAIAPHLRAALTVGGQGRQWLQPIDGVALALALLAMGAAGPTWSRQPDPFLAQSAPLALVLKVTPSMEEADLAPSRLDRAKQKIRDLLELRAGAESALVAYAGSAHLVVPMTSDPGVILPYLDGLAPAVMPVEGNRAADAVALAGAVLDRLESPGAILLLADEIDPADRAALEAEPRLAALWAMSQTPPEPLAGRPLIPASPDGADVARIDRLLEAAFRQALLEDDRRPWEDRGRWLAWPAALLILLSFRRGWTMRWALIGALALLPGVEARAEGLADWFWTPDQQGRLAFERKEYDRAADLFEDPLWRGYAQYRAGQYEAAAQTLARLETAEAAFLQGLAHIRNRAYRDGVRAFEACLARDPNYPGAADNLATAQAIVAFVEDQRAQSDTGEEGGIGADDVVFDNEAAKGAETEIEATPGEGEGLLSAEQWMRTVDTDPGDFLRQRFALEAARGGAPGAEPGAEGGE